MNNDQAHQLAEQGFNELNEALKQGKSELLEKYLTVLARFHKYSFRNAMMITMQCPKASLVAGFRKWQQMGRQVRKGEKGIAIFAPLRYRQKVEADDDDTQTVTTLRGFRVVHVFDISQTDGEDLPDLAAATGDPGQYIDRLEQLIADRGITLEYQELDFAVKGQSHQGRVVIQLNLEPAERLAILAHELAHEMLHTGQRRHETTKKVRETEAEAVAFVVCRACGVDTATRSSDYIQLYRGDTDTLSESLTFIQTTATDILASITDPANKEVA